MRRTKVFSPLWPHVSFLGEFGKKIATSHVIGCDHMTGGSRVMRILLNSFCYQNYRHFQGGKRICEINQF